MKGVSRFLSTYSSDIFGMCSALYELGGLCVIHDASGCNSTYTTHDEPRWFDMDSMVYVSALTESDAVLGNDARLVEEIEEVAREESPAFIAIGGSPVPRMLGTDLRGIARVLQSRTGIPAFGMNFSGMRGYEMGAGEAFAFLVDSFCAKKIPPEKKSGARAKFGEKIVVNILGVTPLDFSIVGNAEALVDLLERNGARAASAWAMNSTLGEISLAGAADVNLVVSASGFAAAKKLRALYGTPFVVGVPIGEKYSEALLSQIWRAAGVEPPCEWNVKISKDTRKAREAERGVALLKQTSAFPLPEKSDGVFPGDKVLVIGEAVFASSLREYLERERDVKGARVLCPLEETCGVLRAGDERTREESDIIRAMDAADVVIADPLYRRALAKGSRVRFIDFPHEAYSGRLFRDRIPRFVGATGSR